MTRIVPSVEENVFANNRLSIHLLSSNPLADMGQHFGDEALRSSLHLAEVLGHEEWGHSFSHTKTAFNRHTGYHGNLFEHYEHDHPIGTHRGARFGRGLIAWAAALESRAVVHGYPWKELGDDVVVCDLGSGVGTMSIEMARAYPNLRFVLQDLPERLKQGQHEIWPERSPGAMDRVQWVPVNFFKDPPVSGCDVYFLKNIIHDWSDQIAIDVLSNVRHAMAPHSRVLVQEHILQHPFRVPDSESVTRQAPEPLMANYGVGRIRQFYVDMQLLNVMNSEVRTLAQYNKLAEAAGLEYVKVWDLGETSVMEYRLRQ
ncbi:hypothetical protein D9613_011402 [Agrocybe pediades]|uniref:O-methyltransferase C-terminal domain-containing protein n=1 Tax=Agrocybe pediades TaxID=84607 RepID=A0A8H4QT55_9AGAR|nr:hypothetical protein D9613_011402 [Agrocybe pediades]